MRAWGVGVDIGRSRGGSCVITMRPEVGCGCGHRVVKGWSQSGVSGAAHGVTSMWSEGGNDDLLTSKYPAVVHVG